MAWEINPEFALQSRLSFGRGARYAWAAIGGALFLGFGGFSLDGRPAFGLAQAGAFLLLGALPYGAIQVRGLERTGHFDTRRLTGRSPVALGVALVGGSAWALALASIALLSAGRAAGYAFPLFTLAGLVLMGAALGLLVLLLPASTLVDSWMLLVFLVLGVVVTVHVMGDNRGAALGTVIVSLLVYPWAVPLALRRIRAGSVAAGCAPVSLRGSTARMTRTRLPEFSRMLSMGRTSLMTAAPVALTTPLLILWVLAINHPHSRDPLLILIVYVPLLVAAYEAGGRARDERAAGALERILLTGQRPWAVVPQIAAAAIPFLLPSVTAAAALAVLDSQLARAFLAPWPMVAAMWIFGGIAEGLRGKRPGTYLAVLVLLAAIGAALAAPNNSFAIFMDLGASGSALPEILMMAATIAVAIGSCARAELPPLRGWIAIAAAAAIGTILVGLSLNHWVGPPLAAALPLTGGLFVSRKSTPSVAFVALCAVACGAACAIATYYWIDARDYWSFLSLRAEIYYNRFGETYVHPVDSTRGVYSTLTGVYGAFGLAFAWLAHRQYGSSTLRSFLVRGLPLVIAIGSLALRENDRVFLANHRFMLRTAHNGFAVAELLLAALLAGVTVVLALREWRAPVR
jgi:hypothetical protein